MPRTHRSDTIHFSNDLFFVTLHFTVKSQKVNYQIIHNRTLNITARSGWPVRRISNNPALNNANFLRILVVPTTFATK